MAIFYVAKSSLGAGLLLVPSAFARLGFGGGCVATGLGALTTGLTAGWVARTAVTVACPDYVSLVAHLFQHSFHEAHSQSIDSYANDKEKDNKVRRMKRAFALRVLITLLATGMSMTSLVVYFRTIRDALYSPALLGTIIGKRMFGMTLMWAILFPLACVKSTAHLGWCSVAGLVGILYVVGVVAVDAVQAWHIDPSVQLMPLDRHLWSPVSSILFAYASQFWIPQVALSMEKDSDVDNLTLSSNVCVERMAMTASCLAFLFYAVMGISGYARYGSQVAGHSILFIHDVIHNTSSSNSSSEPAVPWSYRAGRLGLAFVFACTFPLKVAPIRLAMRQLVQNRPQKNHPGNGAVGQNVLLSSSSTGKDHNSSLTDVHDEDDPYYYGLYYYYEYAKHFLETAMIVLAVLTIDSYGSKKTERLFDFVGATASAPLALLIPVWMAWRLKLLCVKRHDSLEKNNKLSMPGAVAAAGIFVLGLVLWAWAMWDRGSDAVKVLFSSN